MIKLIMMALLALIVHSIIFPCLSPQNRVQVSVRLEDYSFLLGERRQEGCVGERIQKGEKISSTKRDRVRPLSNWGLSLISLGILLIGEFSHTYRSATSKASPNLDRRDHKRQARPFILSLDAQIPTSPKECLPKENVNYLNKKTEVYLHIRSSLISDYPEAWKRKVRYTIRHNHPPHREPHLLTRLIVQASWSEEVEPHRAGLAWKEGYPKSLFRSLVRVSSMLMALPNIANLLTMSNLGPQRQPTTKTYFALAQLAPTRLLPTIVKDLSLHHSRNLTCLLG
ncbi:hypothetical protein RDI58_013140 [Solanum bulbocastanum]|uniref:Uncharacterized protein n=1 Tax=Solanum bulbocastanum TaxID=147425 RepID=A0AAN8YEY9_SOLBU